MDAAGAQPCGMLRAMLASVTLRAPDGELHVLCHGDIIGRLWSAGLPLDDARVSEAHAMVSLRGGKLKLLALRGLFALEGKPVKELTLTTGQRIAFARGLELVVMQVVLPTVVLGIEGPGLALQPLPGVASLSLTPSPVIEPRYRSDAAAVFWSSGDGWQVRLGDAPAQPLAAGWTLAGPRGTYRVTEVSLAQAGQAVTLAAGRVLSPLRLELHYDTAHVHREGAPTLTLSGHPARLLSGLAEVGTAVSWEDLALVLWPEDTDRNRLRRRFDTVVGRLRKKLREGGVRTDLVRPDGAGNFSLVLGPQDAIDDRG